MIGLHHSMSYSPAQAQQQQQSQCLASANLKQLDEGRPRGQPQQVGPQFVRVQAKTAKQIVSAVPKCSSRPRLRHELPLDDLLLGRALLYENHNHPAPPPGRGAAPSGAPPGLQAAPKYRPHADELRVQTGAWAKTADSQQVLLLVNGDHIRGGGVPIVGRRLASKSVDLEASGAPPTLFAEPTPQHQPVQGRRSRRQAAPGQPLPGELRLPTAERHCKHPKSLGGHHQLEPGAEVAAGSSSQSRLLLHYVQATETPRPRPVRSARSLVRASSSCSSLCVQQQQQQQHLRPTGPRAASPDLFCRDSCCQRAARPLGQPCALPCCQLPAPPPARPSKAERRLLRELYLRDEASGRRDRNRSSLVINQSGLEGPAAAAAALVALAAPQLVAGPGARRSNSLCQQQQDSSQQAHHQRRQRRQHHNQHHHEHLQHLRESRWAPPVPEKPQLLMAARSAHDLLAGQSVGELRQQLADQRRRRKPTTAGESRPEKRLEPAIGQMYESLASELKAKLSDPQAAPILLPPRDYDTLTRKQGKLSGIEQRRSTNRQLVGPAAAAAATPSEPMHRRQRIEELGEAREQLEMAARSRPDQESADESLASASSSSASSSRELLVGERGQPANELATNSPGGAKGDSQSHSPRSRSNSSSGLGSISLNDEVASSSVSPTTSSSSSSEDMRQLSRLFARQHLQGAAARAATGSIDSGNGSTAHGAGGAGPSELQAGEQRAPGLEHHNPAKVSNGSLWNGRVEVPLKVNDGKRDGNTYLATKQIIY